MDHVTAKYTSCLALVQEHMMGGTEILLKNTRKRKRRLTVGSKIALQIPLCTVIVLTFKKNKKCANGNIVFLILLSICSGFI